MAAIQNDRDLALQATIPRLIPILIPIDKVDGLPERLDGIDSEIDSLGVEVNGLLNNTKDLSIRVSSITVSDTTETTLTVIKKNGLTGTPVWSIFAGSATITGSGDSVTIAGSSVTSSSITVKASINGKDAFATINKTGALATANTVNLTTQVTGQLANSNVSGLGALALLNTVNLNTQTTGALNGQTQVTNLGTLAYANAIAANQIGAGTLAAGVIYSGTINADKINGGSFTGKEFTGGTFTGSTFQTATSGNRVVMDGEAGSSERHTLRVANDTQTVVYMSTDVPVRVMKDSAMVYLGWGPGAITIDSPSSHMILRPRSSFPALKYAGSVFMHSTHGLCISDGTQWLKTTWTPV